MRPLKRLIHEVHRRSLWQVVGIYLVGAWIGYQVVLALTDGLGLPDWVPPLAFILFVIGLPIVVATAFVQEGAPAIEDFRRAARGTAPGDDALEPHVLRVDDALAAAPSYAAPPADPFLQRFLTWPRALLGGVLAFALLGAGTTGYVAMRALGIGPVGSLIAAGVLDAGEPILVADFHSAQRDSAIAAVVSEAFRIDLARSTLVRSVEPSAVRGALLRMGRDEDTLVDAALAHEIAVRDGIPAYVVGEVSGLGAGFVITARLVATSGSETLVPLRETARDTADLVPAIDRLSRALRERTGESLRTIRREPPLAQVTTSSLEALRKYTDGRREQAFRTNQPRALELYMEAVALDSAFASAWRSISTIHTNYDRPRLAHDAAERALRFQDRLTEVERHMTIAQRASSMRDHRNAAAAYERALSIDPRNITALNNLGWTYTLLDEPARAEHYYRRGLTVDSNVVILRRGLARVLTRTGRFDEARAELERVLTIEPDADVARINLIETLAAAGDYEAADRAARALIEDPTTSARLGDLARTTLILSFGPRGRYRAADSVQAAAARSAAERETTERHALWRRFWVELEVLGQPRQARATLDRLVPYVERQARGDSVVLASFAEACFVLRDIGCGMRYLERAGLAAPPGPLNTRRYHELHAQLAAAQGDHDAALRLLRAPPTSCTNCAEVLAARVFLDAGQPDSAASAYERFLATPSWNHLYRGAWQLGVVHERLADYYDERSDAEAAARHYTRMVELWQQADPELQPRVERARQALRRLGGEAGGR